MRRTGRLRTIVEPGEDGIDRDVLGLMMAGVPLEDARRQAAEHHSTLGEADLASGAKEGGPT
jgi:simple sugar transport system ATP-binding protein